LAAPVQVGFQLPARSGATPHRDPVLRVTDTPAAARDGSFVACSQDGLVTFWSHSMQLRRAKSIVVSSPPPPSRHLHTSSAVITAVHKHENRKS